jgi:hypothetical protein
MGRVAALTATGSHQFWLAAQDQQCVEQMLFCASCYHTTAELAQDRGIEAMVGQFQSQPVFLIDAAADSIGRPPTREVINEL